MGLKVYFSRLGAVSRKGGTAAIGVFRTSLKSDIFNIICRFAQNIITNYKKEEQ